MEFRDGNIEKDRYTIARFMVLLMYAAVISVEDGYEKEMVYNPYLVRYNLNLMYIYDDSRYLV